MFQVQDLVPSYCEQNPGMGPVQDSGPKWALGINQPQEKDQDGTYHLVCLKGWTYNSWKGIPDSSVCGSIKNIYILIYTHK